MATTSENAGNFECSELLDVLVEIDRIWDDSIMKRDYESKVEALRAIREEQTAFLQILENPEKDIDLKVHWPQDCNESLADCSNRCTIGGPIAESGCKSYALDICKTAGFSINENTFRTSNLTRAQVVAKSMAKRLKELDEYLAQTMVAKLDAFAGENQLLDGIGDPDSDLITYIAPEFWNPDVYGYFVEVQVMNQFSDAFLLHGRNLYQIYWQATMANANQNEKDKLLKLEAIRSYWDMWNVDSIASGGKTSYMIQKGAVAFANKAYYPLNSPVTYFHDQRWSIESKALPGVFYDVIYNNECVNPNEVKHNFSLYVKAGIFLNPFGCNEDVTGVIKFVCGTNAGS